MTTYPAAGDYYKAVQAPARAFAVPKLQQAEFVYDTLGPTLARGSSAVVFQAEVGGSMQALRCYIRDDASSWERYSALGEFLAGRDLDPFVSAVTWIDSAIRVNGAAWPVLQMPWIDGRTLNEYVDFLVTGSNAAALGTLAQKWRELIVLLQDTEFAHGDLQHGNVLVDTAGSLRLVDFDGIWIPQLAGLPSPTEYGHPNYQHPGHHLWGRWLDTFSALVIYASLVALSKDPGLWLALYNSKNLLFSKGDFYPPHQTEVWKQLAGLRDPQVDELARRLKECCDPTWVPETSLETLLRQRAAPPRPVPVQRWWELTPNAVTLPAPPPLSAPLGTAGTGPLPQLSRTTPPAGSSWWATGDKQRTQPPAQARPSAQQPPAPPPAARPRQGLASAGLALGLGILLLITGAVQGAAVLVFIGLALGAGGVYLLIARTGP